MITPIDIAKATMTESKRQEAKNDLFSFYIGRPLTYVLTVPFLYTKISPNVITFISIMFSLAGFIMCCIANTCVLLTVAWALFFMWSMLDGVDGNIARYRKQFSKLGTVYDTMGGYIAIICMLFGAGVAAYHNPVLLDRWFEYEEYRYLLIIAGSLSSIFDIFPRLMLHNILSTLKDNTNADRVKDKSKYNFFEIVALNITSPSGGMMVLFIVDVCGQALDIFTYFNCLINFLKMLVTLFIMFRQANREPEINSTEKKQKVTDSLDENSQVQEEQGE